MLFDICAGVRKMPTAMTSPTTSAVADHRPSCRLRCGDDEVAVATFAKNRSGRMHRTLASVCSLERVCKLSAIGNESAGQTKKGIATLSGFFPIDDESAEAIKPSMGSFNYPSSGLSTLVRWDLVRSSRLRRDVCHIILAA